MNGLITMPWAFKRNQCGGRTCGDQAKSKRRVRTKYLVSKKERNGEVVVHKQ
jgi:hypothetical protein